MDNTRAACGFSGVPTRYAATAGCFGALALAMISGHLGTFRMEYILYNTFATLHLYNIPTPHT